MRMTGATRFHRLLACVLALVMGLTILPAQAATLAGWEGVDVSVLWTDPSGTTWQYPAVRVPDSEGLTQAWWIQLPQDALGSVVQAHILHPDPGYVYYYPDRTLNLYFTEDKNAPVVDGMYAFYIGYSYNGVENKDAGTMLKLLLSTQQPPFAYEDVLPGGVMLPAGDEGFSGAPGAELITPGAELITPGVDFITPGSGGYETPSVVTATVDVYYYHQDGYELDHQVVTLQGEGTHFISPQSSKTAAYELVSDEVCNVYLDGSGWIDLASVSFIYRDVARPVQPVQPVQQVTISVPIYDSYGRELASPQRHTLAVGTHYIEAPAGNAFPGYQLISEAIIEVTVYSDGTWTPTGDELSFWYGPVQEEEEQFVPVEPVQKTATLTLYYRDRWGNDVAPSHAVTLGDGTHTIKPDETRIPAGYRIIPGTDVHTVKVSGGRATPGYVTFTFEAVQAAPSVYDVTVYYYDTLGNEIAPRQTIQLTPGVHQVYANPQNLPDGYALSSANPFQLTVGSDGLLDRDAKDVGFWYAKKQVQVRNATITVRYVDAQGRTIAGPFTQELAGDQTHQVWPDASVIPAAYDVSAAQPVKVTVSAEGYASPGVVSFVAELRRESADMPVGVEILRYGVVNSDQVALRTEPYVTKGNSTVILRVRKGGMVYMLASERNSSGEMWTRVVVDGREGYMKSDFIDMLTAEANDAYMSSVGATPVPTATPAPTESFVQFITPVPVTPEPVTGYAVLRQRTALRTGAGSGEMTLMMLESEELVIVGESYVSGSGESWNYVRTLDNLAGFVPTSSLRQVTQQEADWRIEYWYQQNATPAPTILVTNTPAPEQLQGYGLTTAANVPLRRMPSEQSRIVDYLDRGTVVFITGQTYADGVTWQNVAVDGESGYIRSDLCRLMTEREETEYLTTFTTAAPAITPTTNPYDVGGLSSYGYVTTNNVNFRAAASTSSGKLGTLHQYAMALVLGSERVSGTTWYHVNYGGQSGYIHGDYFHQMTLGEFARFYGSDQYRQGLKNNGDDQSDSGSTGAGGQVSPEDFVVDDWYSSGSVVQPSFAPFVPVPTVAPIDPTATPTLPPLPGYVTQGGSSKPQQTPATGSGQVGSADSDLPLPGATGSVTYPMQDSPEKGGNGLVWLVVIGLLVVTIGGAAAFMQHQRKKREIEMRAAQRRAQQARSAGGRPYARQGAQQPRTGAYPQYGPHVPLFPQDPPVMDPYAAPQHQTGTAPVERPHARAAEEAAPARRPGRRTTWQQAHQDDPGTGA